MGCIHRLAEELFILAQNLEFLVGEMKSGKRAVYILRQLLSSNPKNVKAKFYFALAEIHFNKKKKKRPISVCW